MAKRYRKCVKVLGVSNLGWAYDQKASATPYQGHGEKISEMRQILGGIQFRLSVRWKGVQHFRKRCRAHSGGLRPPPCQPAFGRLLGASRWDNDTTKQISIIELGFFEIKKIILFSLLKKCLIDIWISSTIVGNHHLVYNYLKRPYFLTGVKKYFKHLKKIHKCPH